MKYLHIFFYILILLPFLATAQDTGNAFTILRLPYSSRAAALGGTNISVIDDDITLAHHNPALLANVSDKTVNLMVQHKGLHWIESLPYASFDNIAIGWVDVLLLYLLLHAIYLYIQGFSLSRLRWLCVIGIVVAVFVFIG